MRLNELSLLKRASVTWRGAVLLGNSVVCDSHEDGRLVRVVTHAHSDHIIGLNDSIRRCPLIALTRPTAEILWELGYRIPRSKLLTLDYGFSVVIGGEELRLEYARHIVGSAQVVLEDEEGYRLVYTGDFKLPGTPILESDVLVIESTYGSPNYVRPFKDHVEYLLPDLVKELLAEGPVYVYGYHGKLQEAMQLLREHGVDAPFIASRKVYMVTRVCTRYGVNVGEILLDGTREAAEVKRGGWYVYFTHSRSRIRLPEGAGVIVLSGWEFDAPIRRLGPRRFLVALSDHADFEQLLEYVEGSSPKLVIVDAYRGGRQSRTLAKEIERRLGVKAIPLP